MRVKVLGAFVLAITTFLSEVPAQQPDRVTITYSSGGSNWPMFVAMDGGYYQKYGIGANMAFTVHPAEVAMLVSGEAQFVSYSLEQMMQAASKDDSLVMIASALNKAMFVIMARAEISSVPQLRGKRIGVSQLGDAAYTYSRLLLQKSGMSTRTVDWVPIGTDVNGRIAALMSGRIDATLLTAPAYFAAQRAGLNIIANFAERDDLFISVAFLMQRRVLAAHPDLAERFLKAHAEGVLRLYQDKPFAVKAYMHYDKVTPAADVDRLYDLYTRANAFERVPYVLKPAIAAVIDQQLDPRASSEMRAVDFRKSVNRSIIDGLVKSGFYERTFGTAIKDQETSRGKIAFGDAHFNSSR